MLYKKITGNPNAPLLHKTPENYLLGSWQNHQRQFYKKGKLSPDRINRLEGIGFTWNVLEEQFEKGFQETLFFKQSTGNPNAPHSYKTPEGYRLGGWQSVQRQFYKKGKLSPDRIKRLNEIGFIWMIVNVKPNRLGWDFWYKLTTEYKNEFGNPNAKVSYKTAEGYRLGSWQSHQRTKKEKLSIDQIRRLEEIGFTWEILEERFEKGFQETLFYKKSTGNPNAPLNYKTPEGYRFGKWQSHQRQFYNKGTLSSDRIRQLEEIGFTWDLLEEQFEKGFQETLLYKKSTGNPNAPASHKTAEGFRLGAWQNTKRVHYKKGKLFPDRIKRLEEIGFKWRSSD